MSSYPLVLATVLHAVGQHSVTATAAVADSRLREQFYDPHVVVTVPVKRGVVSLVLLADDESITEAASGLGADCSKPEAAWCITSQPGGRSIFVKAKSSATSPNNVTVITTKRSHAFRFLVLADSDAKQPVYRLLVKAPAPLRSPSVRSDTANSGLSAIASILAALPSLAASTPSPSNEPLVSERLKAKPHVLNSSYSVAEGAGSADLVPSLIFDDGRFTYLQYRGSRPVPAVFDVLGDNSETLVNARLEDDLLVIDRVSRRFMLRAGAAVVGVWNDAFDMDGGISLDGTTVPGVRRVLKAGQSGGIRPTLESSDD